MIFRTKRMRLTAQGRALEHGSKGETIRIQNMKTRKIIDATVIGSGTVSVLAPGRVALK